MTGEEFAEAKEQAELGLWSSWANFHRQLAGYTIFRGKFAVPKWELFINLSQTERESLVCGNHSEYTKRVKPEFDEVAWNQSESE